jgi:hypothetical protein
VAKRIHLQDAKKIVSFLPLETNAVALAAELNWQELLLAVGKTASLARSNEGLPLSIRIR